MFHAILKVMVSAIQNSAPYYMRQSHFDSDRMAGSIAHWKNNSPENIKKNQSLHTDNAISLIDSEPVSPQDTTAPTMSFGELLDILNPLHHIPVVGNYYRSLTGDEISPVASIIGGSIYGGAIGGITSLANAAINEHTNGQGVADTIFSNDHNDDEIESFFTEEPRTAGHERSKIELSDINWSETV